MSNETTEKRATHRCRRCGALWGQLADWAKISGTKDCWEHPLSDLEIITPQAEPRAAPPISLEEQAQPDAQDLTEEEIAKLEALEAAATPGDWQRHDSPANFDGRGLPIWDEDAQSELWDRTGDEFLTQGWHCKRTKENFDFIAAARSAIPRLLANEKRRRGIK